MTEEERNEERAEECIKKIKATLNEYGFFIAGDWNGDAYIRDQKTGETYDFR